MSLGVTTHNPPHIAAWITASISVAKNAAILFVQSFNEADARPFSTEKPGQ